MEKYNTNNPERIRYWVQENIHMVWREIETLQQIRQGGFILRISFWENSWPIVSQWRLRSSPELGIGTEKERDYYVSKEVWYISPNFFSIHDFKDWVNNVKYPA